MCFSIDVFPLKSSLLRTAAAFPPDALRVEMVKDHLTISEEGGCACSLLADDADWNRPVWSLRPEVLAPLSRTVVALGERFPEGFTVQPIWIGDPIRDEFQMSAAALAEAISSNQLRNWTRYVVDPKGA